MEFGVEIVDLCFNEFQEFNPQNFDLMMRSGSGWFATSVSFRVKYEHRIDC